MARELSGRPFRGMLPPVVEPQPASGAPVEGPKRATPWTRFGVGLIVVSMLLWVPLPVLPFLSVDGTTKVSVAGGLVVGAEVTFWLGAALAGPAAARRMRSWLWRRRAASGAAADETTSG